MNPVSHDLVLRVSRSLDALAPAGARCLVAVSGGPDSLALLDLLTRPEATHGRPLVVGHVDHGIGDQSARVAEQVATAAARSGLAFHAIRLELGADCSETRARSARRRSLRELADMADAQVIVLAHHAEDQAETVLLRLLRGSGPAGLAGMSARRGRWIRPLLDVHRAELIDHLEHRGLSWWEDPANRDPRHLRSWLRTDILPRLEARLPDLVPRLGAVARQAGSARRAWDDIPALVPELEHRVTAHGISVAAPSLLGYRSEVRHAVVAALGRRFGVPIGARRLAAIDRLLLAGSGGGVVELSGRLVVELAQGRLTFHRDRPATPEVEYLLEVGGEVEVGEGRLKVALAMAADVVRTGWATTLSPGQYVARTWRPGDRIRPLGGRGTRAISDLFREAQVPRRYRRQWPVIARSDSATVVWVPGICRSDCCIPLQGTEALHVECAIS